jgi:DNA-directed RNA polymerase subunit RPC12/RpoP
MKIIYICFNCNKEYTEKDEGLEVIAIAGIKCKKCGGYIVTPSGKVKMKVIDEK